MGRSLDFVRAGQYGERPRNGPFRLLTQAYVLLELHSRRTSTWAKGIAAALQLFGGQIGILWLGHGFFRGRRGLDVAFVLLRQGTSADFQEGSLTGFCVADRYGERPWKGQF